MIYVNLTGSRITFRIGAGPGRFTEYKAEPGKYVTGPDGYCAQFERKGFTPLSKVPKERRGEIDFFDGGGTEALGKARPRNNRDKLVNPDTVGDDGVDGSSQARAAAAVPSSRQQPAQLRQDGPTLEEYLKAGYTGEGYPPRGYAAKESDLTRAWEESIAEGNPGILAAALAEAGITPAAFLGRTPPTPMPPADDEPTIKVTVVESHDPDAFAGELAKIVASPPPPRDKPVVGAALAAKAALVARGTLRVETPVDPVADAKAEALGAPLMPALPGMPPAKPKGGKGK